MKRFCIVSFCNMYVLPYAKTYIDAVLKAGAACDLLFWDRDAVDGENDHFDGCRKICYQRKMTPESSAKDKLLGYIEASHFFRTKLRAGTYDGVIFLQTHAAVACGGVLRRRYMGRYIVDIRDFTLENYALYRRLEQTIIGDSYATVISSPAYSRFLPAHEYVVAHNYTPFPVAQVEEIRRRADGEGSPIRISFVGTVRFIEMDKKILRLFANDSRFQINYFGTGSQVLERFCSENDIRNVAFHGSFSPDMTTSFYRATDMINNLYGNNNPFLDYALSNKLYHAGQFHMPILVCPDTYMADVTQEYRMGFVFDVERAEEPDRLYDWYQSIDREQLAAGCDAFIERVEKENSLFYEMIDAFVDGRASSGGET